MLAAVWRNVSQHIVPPGTIHDQCVKSPKLRKKGWRSPDSICDRTTKLALSLEVDFSYMGLVCGCVDV